MRKTLVTAGVLALGTVAGSAGYDYVQDLKYETAVLRTALKKEITTNATLTKRYQQEIKKVAQLNADVQSLGERIKQQEGVINKLAGENLSLAQQVATLKKQLKSPTPNTAVTKRIKVIATHYGSNCAGCSGITATGDNVKNSIYVNGLRVIAVDPNVIPLRTVVTVTTPYGTFKALTSDTGGAIKGNKIDILVESEQESNKYGVVEAEVSW